MSIAHHHLDQKDASFWSDDGELFHIDQNTIELVKNFRDNYPDITQEFFNKELNAAIEELIIHMAIEFEGQMISGLALEGRSAGTEQLSTI